MAGNHAFVRFPTRAPANSFVASGAHTRPHASKIFIFPYLLAGIRESGLVQPGSRQLKKFSASTQ